VSGFQPFHVGSALAWDDAPGCDYYPLSWDDAPSYDVSGFQPDKWDF